MLFHLYIRRGRHAVCGVMLITCEQTVEFSGHLLTAGELAERRVFPDRPHSYYIGTAGGAPLSMSRANGDRIGDSPPAPTGRRDRSR
jgi:hypothetical protein